MDRMMVGARAAQPGEKLVVTLAVESEETLVAKLGEKQVGRLVA
jgi:hypothetical protein